MPQRGVSLLVLSVATLCYHRVEGCAEGYQCYEDTARDLTWVIRDEGQVAIAPTCKQVCETALCGTGTFHQSLHDEALDVFSNRDMFNALVDTAFNIECSTGRCWDGISSAGQVWMTRDVQLEEDDFFIGDDGRRMSRRNCYLPEDGKIDALIRPGNANCFGERYTLLCPCEARELHNACSTWSSPPQSSATAVWPTSPNGTTCLERINYWRKRACDEGWPECPPCGLPPMVECEACHACANSEAEFDKNAGAHASYGRCGGQSQGQGGGATCANVLDAFVSERDNFEDNRCVGHCGPIVAHGCQTFQWGRQDPEVGNFHTLNWRACNTEQCDGYCEDPDDNECFTHALSPAPSEMPSPETTNDTDAEAAGEAPAPATATPPASSSSGGTSASMIGVACTALLASTWTAL